uniref:Ig-like domain-containing protein n=1 Tax=Clastoptera arizonana TaxID=38151 RepID=A0A1B6E5R0_9HEMI
MLFCAVVFLLISVSYSCPSSCVCRWKGGKQTVECVDKGLITIPDGMDHGTQVLDFTGNNLHELSRERFLRVGIVNLQKVYLSKCGISQIDGRAFSGLNNLVELDLSENIITEVPTETFYDFRSLMRLTMNKNSMRCLKRSSFEPLTHLTHLELSNCRIETVEDQAFKGLDKLEFLKLDHNFLRNIQGYNTLPEKLQRIDLTNNPWTCDCKMVDLWERLKVFKESEVKCTSPARLRGLDVTSVDREDLACLPKITPSALFLEVAEGKNISLSCKVTAKPEATITWSFQGAALTNDSIVTRGIHFYYFFQNSTDEKTSELFLLNTDMRYNGTFTCAAENFAGKSLSNYTVRISSKEALREESPYDNVVVIIIFTSSLSVTILLSVIVLATRITKSLRTNKSQNKMKSKCEKVSSVVLDETVLPSNAQTHTEHNPDLLNNTRDSSVTLRYDLPILSPNGLYQTLPRPLKMNAANPKNRCARELEFLSKSCEYFAPINLRYTAEGYPVQCPVNYNQVYYVPESLDEGYEGETTKDEI